jgi:hypothetical protein
MADPKITIVMLKAGDKYPAEYYNILQSQIEKNISVLPDIVVFTDNPADVRARCVPIPNDLPRCWGKLAMFDPEIKGIETEYLLFIDVDSIITGNLDALIEYKQELDFIICRDFFYPRFYNSSVFRLRVGSRAHVWEQYIREGYPLEDLEIASYENPIPGYYRGDQCFITAHVKEANTWPAEWVLSYKKSCIDPMGNDNPFLPEDARIVTFHGRPNPWDLAEVQNCWVKDYWP